MPPIRATGAGLSADDSLTTMRLYDAKAPRRVRLDARGAATLGHLRLIVLVVAAVWFIAVVWQPWFAVLPLFLLARNGVGVAIRRRITAWLDRYAVD